MKAGDWVEFINLDKSPYDKDWYRKYLNKPLQVLGVTHTRLLFSAPVGTIFIEYRGVPLVRPARIELLKALKRHLW